MQLKSREFELKKTICTYLLHKSPSVFELVIFMILSNRKIMINVAIGLFYKQTYKEMVKFYLFYYR